MPTIAEDRAFAVELLGGNGLDYALDWIKQNFGPDDVFEMDVLDAWALENGYEAKEGKGVV